MKKIELPIEIEIMKWVIRFPDNNKNTCELIAIDKQGKEYSPRYYAEYGRECEPLNIQEK